MVSLRPISLSPIFLALSSPILVPASWYPLLGPHWSPLCDPSLPGGKYISRGGKYISTVSTRARSTRAPALHPPALTFHRKLLSVSRVAVTAQFHGSSTVVPRQFHGIVPRHCSTAQCGYSVVAYRSCGVVGGSDSALRSWRWLRRAPPAGRRLRLR